MATRLNFVPGVSGGGADWSLYDQRGPKWWSYAKGRAQGDQLGVGKTVLFYLLSLAKETIIMQKPLPTHGPLSENDKREYSYQ